MANLGPHLVLYRAVITCPVRRVGLVHLTLLVILVHPALRLLHIREVALQRLHHLLEVIVQDVRQMDRLLLEIVEFLRPAVVLFVAVLLSVDEPAVGDSAIHLFEIELDLELSVEHAKRFLQIPLLVLEKFLLVPLRKIESVNISKRDNAARL